MATGQLVRIQLAGLGVNRRTRYSKEMMVSGLGLKAVKPSEKRILEYLDKCFWTYSMVERKSALETRVRRGNENSSL